MTILLWIITPTPKNNEHISFQVRNGNWLARELDEDPNNISDCSFLCGDENIAGPNSICTNGTYSISAPNSAAIDWSISPSNAGTIQGQGTNQVQFSLSPSYNGYITLSVYVHIPDCGGVTITKEIYGGKPNFTFDLDWDAAARMVTVTAVGQSGSDISNQGITSMEWQVIGTSGGGYAPGGSCSGFECHARGPFNSDNWAVDFEVTAVNSCGTTIKYITATPPPGPVGKDAYDFVSNPDKIYTINAIVNGVSIPLENNENPEQDFKIKVFDFTGNPVMETTEPKIDISKLKTGIYILKAIIDNDVLTKKVIR